MNTQADQQPVPMPPWSVRTVLVALVLICLLPGMLAAAGLFVYQYKERQAQLKRDTLAVVRALVHAVDHHLFKVGTAAQILATSDTLLEQDLAAFHKRAREVVAISDLTPNIVLRDRDGHQLVNAAVEYGEVLPGADADPHVESRVVFETGQPHISNVFTGAVVGHPVMNVTVPVVVDKRVLYSLSFGIASQHFNRILRAQDLPQGWVAAVLDRNGRIFGRNVDPESFIGNTATPSLWQSLRTSAEGVLHATTQEGIPVLTFHGRSPSTGWYVAIGIPQQELEATLVRHFSMLAVVIAMLFSSGLFFAWFISGKISRAMGRLAAAATALGRGETAPLVSMPHKEAAEVAVAVKRASHLLADRAAALQAREKELNEAHRLARFGTWYWNIKSGEVDTSASIPEIYGRPVPSFVEQRSTLLPEDAWQRTHDAMQEVVRTGRGFDMELQVNHGGGYPIWVHSRSEAVFSDSGEVTALRGTIHDITERKRYEDALLESETAARQAADQAEAQRRRLAAVLEATPVGVFVADAKGELVAANEAGKQIWGLNQLMADGVEVYPEWLGWWADGSERHGHPVEAHEWPMARALRGNDSTYDIIEIAPFDDLQARKIVMMSGAVIRDAEGGIVGGVIAQMDITDRIRVEEELRQADKRKDEFLAMLAHELRNPLAPISAAADLLRVGAPDPARIKHASAIISRQVRHMAGLVDDLLDVSRVTRGLVKLDRQQLDFSHIIKEAVEQVKPAFEAKKHAMNVQLPDQPAPVMGDSKRLVQIVVNLLSNAAKFTPDGGHVNVAVQDKESIITLYVEDDGVGMTPDIKSRAFDMFVQGERTLDRSQGGLGIGLALVRSLAELHGGRVDCDSNGPGMGSRFTVTFPRADSTLSETGLANSDCAVVPSGALKVMVVDDNVDAAQMLTGLLEALGHEVVVEYSSRAALQRARLERPALCLLDIGLPEMDGRELARRLRAQPETADAMMVAITGYAQTQDRQSIKQAGFDHHFAKPVDMAQLVAILSEASKRSAW